VFHHQTLSETLREKMFWPLGPGCLPLGPSFGFLFYTTLINQKLYWFNQTVWV